MRASLVPTPGRMGVEKAALILMEHSQFDRTSLKELKVHIFEEIFRKILLELLEPRFNKALHQKGELDQPELHPILFPDPQLSGKAPFVEFN